MWFFSHWLEVFQNMKEPQQFSIRCLVKIIWVIFLFTFTFFVIRVLRFNTFFIIRVLRFNTFIKLSIFFLVFLFTSVVLSGLPLDGLQPWKRRCKRSVFSWIARLAAASSNGWCTVEVAVAINWHFWSWVAMNPAILDVDLPKPDPKETSINRQTSQSQGPKNHPKHLNQSFLQLTTRCHNLVTLIANCIATLSHNFSLKGNPKLNLIQETVQGNLAPAKHVMPPKLALPKHWVPMSYHLRCWWKCWRWRSHHLLLCLAAQGCTPVASESLQPPSSRVKGFHGNRGSPGPKTTENLTHTKLNQTSQSHINLKSTRTTLRNRISSQSQNGSTYFLDKETICQWRLWGLVGFEMAICILNAWGHPRPHLSKPAQNIYTSHQHTGHIQSLWNL